MVVAPFLKHHKHLDGFTAGWMGDADSGRFLHLGVFVKDLLDVPGVDVVTARDDHVLFAVDDVKIALFVHFGDVAGVEPAVGVRVSAVSSGLLW